MGVLHLDETVAQRAGNRRSHDRHHPVQFPLALDIAPAMVYRWRVGQVTGGIGSRWRQVILQRPRGNHDMRLRHLTVVSLLLVVAAGRAHAAAARQFFDDFESPAQVAHWRAWSNLHQVKMELASPGYESKTCLRLTVPAPDWDTPIVEFTPPIRVTGQTMVRFKLRAAGTIEGLNVRDATEGAEYLLTFPLPGSGWTVVQRYLRNSLYKRFGKPDVPKDGVVGDEISSIQIAYLGTELALDDFEVFEAPTDLPELPPEHLLPPGSYQPQRYHGLETVFPFGVISTVAAGDGANAALFGQTGDERFEDDLLDLKRHGMNAISNFCDDGRVAWRLGLMDRYRVYLVETALANADVRAAKPGDPTLQLIAESRDHPRLLAWYGRDEPQDCLAYLDNKRAVNAVDPNHPVASALNQMQVAKLLGHYMELMMLDPYKAWQEAIAQLKAFSVRYFSLRRQFRAGDVSHDAEPSRLLADQEALRARIATLARGPG